MFRSIDAMALALEKLLGAALIVAVLYNFVNVLGRYVFGQTLVSAAM
jgi:TRAP-type C4-dicarboxylate transport system permease small subunit